MHTPVRSAPTFAQDMVDFIMNMLRRSCQPAELEQKMALVLQSDAPKFTMKLWRMLVYHQKSEAFQRE